MLEEVVAEMASLGMRAPPKAQEWDSNVITPGTEFMHNLSTYLWFYILERMNNDPAWRNIKVIFSDASEPGEGEHKIMAFVRHQRAQPGYDPNQRHILHGLDADLIMLALATHEGHFSILREEIIFGRQDKEPKKNYAQQLLDEETGGSAAAASSVRPMDEWVYNKALQVLDVAVLREYLFNEFRCLQTALPFAFDLERIVDDFVFMCFFVGNDFIPHIPSLDIRDGALDFLMESYKSILPSLGDYLTSPGGTVNLKQVDIILARVSEVEGDVFVRRQRAEDQQSSRNKQRQLQQQVRPPVEQIEAAAVVQPDRDEMNGNAARDLRKSLAGQKRKAAQAEVKDSVNPEEIAPSGDTICEPESDEVALVNEEEEVEEEAEEVVIDSVLPLLLSGEEAEGAKVEIAKRLKERQQRVIEAHKKGVTDGIKYHESGYKERYYSDPFKKQDVHEGGGLSRMCESYVQGLCWVLKYYYQGCPSWQWFYPFHYAPFASDLVNIDNYSISFELSQPFNPVQQLLAVFPSESAHALPAPCRW